MNRDSKKGNIYMTTSQVGVDLIHSFEQFRAKAYKCPGGVWTIGWGSTRIFGRSVVKYDSVTKTQANHQFQKDLDMFEGYIKEYVKVSLNQNQFDALVSLCYNIGQGNLQFSSVIRNINNHKFSSAGDSFLLWNKARNKRTGKLKVLRGLTRRRIAERELFLYADSMAIAYVKWLVPKGIERLIINWQNRKYEIA